MMFLESMQFAHLDPSNEAAAALAAVWFGEVSGSAEARVAQLSARRWLTLLIRRRMGTDPSSRTIAQVVRDAENEAMRGHARLDAGLDTILLNVTEVRAPIYQTAWQRTLGLLRRRPRSSEGHPT
jgi:hypothetical protein